MLTLILIITLTNFEIIIGEENSDNKFINSLPEKQKKEFLQKVEKRIRNEVPEVKSPELNDTNVDLYEKRLEDQSKSVQNILRSEIENLKTHHRRNFNDTGRIEASPIDLTLRTINEKSEATRSKNEGNKIVDFKNIPVIVQYDSKDDSNHKNSLRNTSIIIQNTVPHADKNESKVNVITWENTKPVNVNDSSIEHKRTGRRSNDFDALENVDNATVELRDNAANSSLDSINDTTTVNTESYDVHSTKTTNYALGVSSNLDSDNSKTQSVASDTLKINTENPQEDHKTTNTSSQVEKITEISSTLSYSKFDAKISNSTDITPQAKSGDVAVDTAQYNESTQTHYEISSTTQYYFDEKTSKPSTIIDNGNATIHDLDSNSTVSDKLTTTKKVDSITEITTVDSATESTNNILSTQISDFKADTRKNTSATESNNPESDSHSTYDVDSTKTTNYALGVRSNMDSDNSKTQVAFDTFNINTDNPQEDHKTTNTSSQVENNTMLTQKITEITSTLSYSKFDAKISNSTAKSPQPKLDVVIDTTAEYNESIQTHYEISSTPQYYFDEKTSKPSTIIDNGNATIHDLDNSSAVSDKLKTTKKVNSITESTTIDSATETTNNILSTQISDVNTDTRKDYNTSTTESNNPEFDSHSKEDSDKQPHLVPVYNYDPENAYYNANNQQSQSNIEGGSIIKIKEPRSKSTNFDVNTNENQKSLRVKDVKERIISNEKIKPTFDFYDVILSDVSEESSEDSVLIEKPLKHTLKKIRAKLHRNKMNGKSQDDVNNNNFITIIAEKEHKGDYSGNTNKNDKKSITELFTNFGALLQNLVDRANDNETPSSEGIKDSDKETYKEIANSSETHNKILKNQGLQQIVNIVKHIQDKVGEKRLKQNKNKRSKKEHQSRFHIKDRDEKYKQKQDKIYTSLDHNDINYPNFGSQDTKFNKSASKINDGYLELHINNLKNLIDRNDLGLKKYDWLGTTVLIQAGLEKMQELTDKKLHGKKLHHLDQKLLDFAIKLYETANEIIEAQANEQNLSPRQRKRPKKENLDIYKVLIGMDISTILESRSRSKAEDFKESLDCLEMCLNDLHTAIKQVSLITTYKKQRWFENIKQLYLQSAGDKEYLELFLHLVMARLIDLIDARVKKMNSGYNLKRDKVEVDRIEVEFVLAMRICNKLEELKQ